MNKQHRSQLEINDLIGDAVKNAVARRSQIDSQLSVLSDEQVIGIAGGQKVDICPPTTAGMITYPPITLGYAPPDDTLSIKNVSL